MTSELQDSEPTFTAAEVAEHATPHDCWVIVHGGVYDVSSFLTSHPGGVSALSKAGRAGCDVSSHFERIGHSAKAREVLKTLRVGSLDQDSVVPVESTPATSEHDHAVHWHGQRRMAIMKAHPEVAELFGSNPWTPLIGLVATAVHFTTAVLCGAYLGFAWSVLLAYTVGAVCKMMQFACCHDICHGTAGPVVKPFAMKQLAFHVLTLPSLGGETQQYYAYQHIGHHSSLGTTPPTGTTPRDGSTTIETYGIGQIVRLDDIDGDLPAPSSILLLAFSSPLAERIANKFSTFLVAHGAAPLAAADEAAEVAAQQLDDEEAPHVGTATRAHVSAVPHRSSRWLLPMKRGCVRCFHPRTPLGRAVSHTLLQLGHLGFIIFADVTFGVLLNPAIGLLAAMCALPPCKRLIETMLRKVASHAPPADDCAAASRHFTRAGPMSISEHARALVELADDANARAALSEYIVMGCSFGVHTWTWLTLLIALTYYAGPCALTYVALSDLFLHGFALHPWAGYFLGVHWSDAGSADGPTRVNCQPTMSTYEPLAALLCLNLTYHVEHHDFPNVPWSRLPAVKRAAPEFYDGLNWSPGLWTTLARWLRNGERWTYACNSLERLKMDGA